MEPLANAYMWIKPLEVKGPPEVQAALNSLTRLQRFMQHENDLLPDENGFSQLNIFDRLGPVEMKSRLDKLYENKAYNGSPLGRFHSVAPWMLNQISQSIGALDQDQMVKKAVQLTGEVAHYKKHDVQVYGSIQSKWLFHNDNGPALTYKTGTYMYAQNGLIHRPSGEGPAVSIAGESGINWQTHTLRGNEPNEPNSKMDFYLEDNLLNREDGGPAIDSKYFKAWAQKGLVHRDLDLPAIVTGTPLAPESIKEYYQHGARHRNNGPALVIDSGLGAPQLEVYIKNGLIDRHDGPAIKEPGKEVWVKNGVIDRDDGPAITIGKQQFWVKNGVLVDPPVPNIGEVNTSSIEKFRQRKIAAAAPGEPHIAGEQKANGLSM